MPFQTTIEKRGLLVQWSGRATTAELIRMQEAAHAHSAFETFHYAIHDFRECGHFDHVQGDIEYSAALDGAASMTNAQIRIAIVGASDEIKALVDVYMNTALSPYPLRFFDTMDAARGWVATP